MTITDRSIVAGVFQHEVDAKQAMNDLQQAGFTDGQIRYSVHKGGAGITAPLLNLGFSQEEANYYNSEFMAGRTVVTVNNPDRQQEAYDILMRNDAYDARSRRGQTTDYAQAQEARFTTDTRQKIQLREEQLTVQKQQVQAGEVSIHKEVVTEEQTLNVPVSHEEVYIERRPVTDTSPADTSIGQDETISVPVSEEQVKVTKQPVVKEEIKVGKRVVQENQQVTDTVQREEARIDRTGNVNVDDPSPQTDQ